MLPVDLLVIEELFKQKEKIPVRSTQMRIGTRCTLKGKYVGKYNEY